MPLYRLLYQSEMALSGAEEVRDTQIDLIVAASTRSNARDGLSGAMIAEKGVFIQALEGPLNALEATFERICSDLRHRHVRLVDFAAAEERVFPEWSMVRVDNQCDVLRLCSALNIEPGDYDLSKTNAVISMMRAVLVIRPDQPN